MRAPAPLGHGYLHQPFDLSRHRRKFNFKTSPQRRKGAKEGKPLMPSRQPFQTTLTVMALESTPEHESHDGFPHPPPLSRMRARGASWVGCADFHGNFLGRISLRSFAPLRWLGLLPAVAWRIALRHWAMDLCRYPCLGLRVALGRAGPAGPAEFVGPDSSGHGGHGGRKPAPR
jgi:hypothetical protein